MQLQTELLHVLLFASFLLSNGAGVVGLVVAMLASQCNICGQFQRNTCTKLADLCNF